MLAIRHGQSEANVDLTIMKTVPDVLIPLTDLGRAQAAEAGKHLLQYLNATNIKYVKIWNSPFNRTRETASIVLKQLLGNSSVTVQTEENNMLIERQFGLIPFVEGYGHTDSTRDYREFYENHVGEQSFFVKPPLGESPFDVSMRMELFHRTYIVPDTFYFHVIVGHGGSLRLLAKYLARLPYDFEIKRPANASISGFNSKGLQDIFNPSEITY